MKSYNKKFNIKSKKQVEFIDITDIVQEQIDNSGIREGQVTIYSPHTTMSIVINHNEPMLVHDFMRMIYKLAPADESYSHDLFELKRVNTSDGRSNGHSHCKSMLLGISETVPVEKGKMMITEKQSIFAVELDGSRERDIAVQVIGL
ncbi:secondary thiamine-phosphate synthase enzyme YjbQ [Patescibacteria group bacterium]